MKTLVAYYSRTGNCRKIAQALAEGLGADIEEIIDTKDRSGAIGWMLAGKDATFKSTTEIGPVGKDPAGYDLVVIGTPVWAFTMTPAIRTYLTKYGKAIKKAAFFCTQGGKGDATTYQHMQDLSAQTPIATMTFLDKDIKSDQWKTAVEEFVHKLA